MLALAYRQEVAHLGVTVGLVHPSWIDTDLVRTADADLPSFQGLRRRLPYPGSSCDRRRARPPAQPCLCPAGGRRGQLGQGGPELTAGLALDEALRGPGGAGPRA